MLITIFIATYLAFQIEFDIMMKDDADHSISEIDNFHITIPFSSGNQEQVFTGNRDIAKITLRYDIICIEPDMSTTSITSSELIGNLLSTVNVLQQFLFLKNAFIITKGYIVYDTG